MLGTEPSESRWCGDEPGTRPISERIVRRSRSSCTSSDTATFKSPNGVQHFVACTPIILVFTFRASLMNWTSPRLSAFVRPTSHRIISSRIAFRRMDYSSVATPEQCYVDFCLIPVRILLLTRTLFLDCTRQSAGKTTHEVCLIRSARPRPPSPTRSPPCRG